MAKQASKSAMTPPRGRFVVSWSAIQVAAGCSRATIAKVAKRAA